MPAGCFGSRGLAPTERHFIRMGVRLTVNRKGPCFTSRQFARAAGLSRIVVVAIVAFVAWPVVAGEPLAILPREITLDGPFAQHRLVVGHMHEGQFQGLDLARIQLTSSDPQVATIDQSTVVPAGTGRALVTATVGDESSTAVVDVVGFDQKPTWSFRNHVEPILAKMGCSTGACHGALAGKGGFKLSLRGYDPGADWHTITRQARGRRIELADPGRSLILAKPSGAIPHKGGVRFEVDSLEYRVLSEWIAAGAAPPEENDPRLERLEVLPADVLLEPAVEQRLIVRAHYSDGRVEDVTRWAKYASTDEEVAKINDHGLVTGVGYGQGAVTAWFSSQIAIARVTSPYPHSIPEHVFAQSPQRNFIDRMVLEQLKKLNIAPSPRATDETFLRRAFLDTLGVLPTSEQVQAFLADSAPDKRDVLIDWLLSQPEFVDYWTYKWSDLLLINGRQLPPQAVKPYYEWVRQQVEQNTPWDQLVRDIVTATGDNVTNGATNFFALHQDPENMSENVCQAFLGLSIGCAKCHNHPLEKWTNNQYYAMANLFARVRAKGWGGDSRSGDGRRTVLVVDQGELVQPSTGKPQPPTPLDGQPVSMDSSADRRIHLARWLVSPQNPYFSRAITNRIWANFFGVGLVEAVDDMRVSNPPSNPDLLDAAAQFLVDHQFDLKALIREILQSESYQRSSSALPENREEKRFYSRYYPRRLMAEVMLDAISQVTGVPSEFTEIRQTADFAQKTDLYPKGTRALELYDSAVASYFLETFGRNERMITCECERSNEPSMVQVLHISNGTTINDRLSADSGRIAKLLEAGLTDDQIVEQAYLVSLSRYPTDQERQELVVQLSSAASEDRRQVIEDLFWAILSSREFLFNH